MAAVLADDGSPNINEVQLYIDGVLQAVTASAAQAVATTASQDVMIGAYKDTGLFAGYFNGLIDEVRIYYRALTDTEIAGL